MAKTARPTLGRIVHYHNATHENGKAFAAIVTEAPADTDDITVTVFTPDGGRFSVTLGEKPSEVGAVREWWEWPPRAE